MTMRKLARHEGGAAIIEFALAAPILFTMIFGIAQLGIVMSANAGLQHAVGEAARAAAVYRSPAEGDLTKEEIEAVIADARFGLDPTQLGDVDFQEGTDADGREYYDIDLSYQVPLNFVFVSPTLSISESRRVYRQVDSPAPTGASSSSSSSTGG